MAANMYYMYVYILQCNDGTYYTGVTNNLERRLKEHQRAENSKSYTAKRLPVELVYSKGFQSAFEAIAWEKRLKHWSHQKKEALVHGDYEKLKSLSRKKFERRSSG